METQAQIPMVVKVPPSWLPALASPAPCSSGPRPAARPLPPRPAAHLHPSWLSSSLAACFCPSHQQDYPLIAFNLHTNVTFQRGPRDRVMGYRLPSPLTDPRPSITS